MRTVLLLSGGLDSSTLLYYLKANGHHVDALIIDYGQRHSREIASAELIAARSNTPYQLLFMQRSMLPLFQSARSSQVGLQVDVPLGHYEDESMKTTIVPNRNMVLISLAGAYAVSLRSESVAYAAHSGDHAIYPDCRPEFADSIAQTLFLGTDGVTLIRPFITLTKTDIVRMASELAVPTSLTYSCYNGGALHCGRCGTCYERREAFTLAGVEDKTEYQYETPAPRS